jgi:hypothetical protein
MWFAANLLFKSVHIPSGKSPPIWEQSIRLIEAETEADARDKAERLGRSEMVSYQARSDLVIWTFEGVERVYAIEQDHLSDGVELFSRFLRDAEVTSMMTPFEDE